MKLPVFITERGYDIKSIKLEDPFKKWISLGDNGKIFPGQSAFPFLERISSIKKNTWLYCFYTNPGLNDPEYGAWICSTQSKYIEAFKSIYQNIPINFYRRDSIILEKYFQNYEDIK